MFNERSGRSSSLWVCLLWSVGVSDIVSLWTWVVVGAVAPCLCLLASLCCVYISTFQVYHGSPRDPLTGQKVSEKGLTMRVVSDLTAPFEGLNHVVYCDNYFTSGPLVEMFAKKKIFLVI